MSLRFEHSRHLRQLAYVVLVQFFSLGNTLNTDIPCVVLFLSFFSFFFATEEFQRV